MLGVLQNARRFANASVSYRMTYKFNDFVRDSMGDIIGDGPEKTRTIFGRVKLMRQESGEDGAVPARGYALIINARCGFVPRVGARVIPQAGPFKDVTFTIGGGQPAVMDAQGANWVMSAVHG